MSSISYTIDNTGIAVVTINTPGSAANVLDQESFLALEEFLNKIDREFDKKLIHTVRGVGYVLKETD